MISDQGQLTSSDLGVDLDPRVRGDPRLRQLDALVDGNSKIKKVFSTEHTTYGRLLANTKQDTQHNPAACDVGRRMCATNNGPPCSMLLTLDRRWRRASCYVMRIIY